MNVDKIQVRYFQNKEIEVLKKCMIDELESGTNDYTELNIFFESLKRLTIELKKADDIRYNNHKENTLEDMK